MRFNFFNRTRRYNHLIGNLLIRDLKSRYAGSAMGLFWAVFNPLFLVGLYTYVFSIVLKVRWGESGSATGYVFYLLCGVLPWIAIQESLSRSATCIVDNAHLLKNFSFPSKIVPFYLSLSALVNQLIGTIIVIICLPFWGTKPGYALLLLPVVILLQFIFMIGLSWFLSAINVLFRDTASFLGIFLLMWMFLTPIFYLESAVPEKFRIVLLLNPLNYLISVYRSIILEGKIPFLNILLFGIFAVIFCSVGYLSFEKKQPFFVDYV